VAATVRTYIHEPRVLAANHKGGHDCHGIGYQRRAPVTHSFITGIYTGFCTADAKARLNWREQPARESLTGAQWRSPRICLV
jgi:hypothetical protein